jgi:hypothetical protein
MFDQSGIMLLNTPEPSLLAQMIRIFPIVLVDNQNLFPSEQSLFADISSATEMYIRDESVRQEVECILGIELTLMPYDGCQQCWYFTFSDEAEVVTQRLLIGEANLQVSRQALEKLV